MFLHEILGKQRERIEIAQKAFNEASSDLDGLSDEVYSEATLILQVLRDNVAL
jgi:14-3-3 protein epsilon